MPFTNADYLPTYEELDVPEIKMTSAPLKAAAHHFGKYCDEQCKEFMLCNKEERDPRKCLQEGKEVTKCGVQFFNKLRKNCAEEFTQYWNCIDHSGFDLAYKGCRKQQAVFDKCVFEQLGQERPPLGYFTKVRVHSTSRPKPNFGDRISLPEEIPDIPNPKDHPEPESVKLGHRSYFP